MNPHRSVIPPCRVLAPLALLVASAESAESANVSTHGRAPHLRVMCEGEDTAAASFEGLAALRRPLVGVTELTDAQLDAFARLEVLYRPRFRQCGSALLALFAEAGVAGGAPAAVDILRLDAEASALRQQQLGQARAVLHDDAQRARFDTNVANALTPLRAYA